MLIMYIALLSVADFVFVDESGVNRAYRRERYRAKRGVKLHWEKPGRKSARTNVIAGLHGKRHVAVRITNAVRVYANSTNTLFFNDWFEWELIPVIPRFSLVIMDNASFHNREQLIEIAARYDVYLLFLPPYSPDFNPIEKSWADLKHWLVDNAHRFPSTDFAIEFYLGVYGF